MAFQPCPNTISVTFVGVQNGTPVVNVFHVFEGTGWTTTDMTATGNACISWWRTYIRGGIHPSYTLEKVVVRDLTTATSPQIEIPVTTDNVGLAAGAPAAANMALTLSWRTNTIGRSYRGRTYFGGLPNSALSTAQIVDSTFAAGFVTGGAALISIIQALGHELVVLSRYLNGVARVVGLVTQIISVVCDTKVDSQRKRTAN